MSCLCLGPKRSGKTHLLKALQDPDSIDHTSYSKPTVGTNIFEIKFPTKQEKKDDKPTKPPTVVETAAQAAKRKRNLLKTIKILEIGGDMAPLWRQFFGNVNKIVYVVDTSNLCQISAAGVLLYSILAEPRLQRTKFLLVLTKMDYAYRQMRNEALLMLNMVKLQKEIRQKITIVEASSVSKDGLDKIYQWLQIP